MRTISDMIDIIEDDMGPMVDLSLDEARMLAGFELGSESAESREQVAQALYRSYREEEWS
jgi:hypothetical protein